MTFSEEYLAESAEVLRRLDPAVIEELAHLLATRMLSNIKRLRIASWRKNVSEIEKQHANVALENWRKSPN